MTPTTASDRTPGPPSERGRVVAAVAPRRAAHPRAAGRALPAPAAKKKEGCRVASAGRSRAGRCAYEQSATANEHWWCPPSLLSGGLWVGQTVDPGTRTFGHECLVPGHNRPKTR